MKQATFPDVLAAADLAIQRERAAHDRQIVLLTVVAATMRETASTPTEDPRPVIHPHEITGAATTTSWDWDCVARAETGGNWQAHGSEYSSALGILNQAVREDAQTSAEAQRILTGTASRDEQVQVAEVILGRFGRTAWAWQTRAKCP